MPLRDRPAAGCLTRLVAVTAVALLVPGCASIATQPDDPATETLPPATTAPTPDVEAPGPEPGQPGPTVTGGLLAVEKVGGMCPSGEECRYLVTLDADGSWRTESDSGEVTQGSAPAETVAQVATAVAEADREALVATPFTGECERHMDGTEVVLTLRPGEDDELVLPGCTYALPRTGPLVAAAQALLETARR